MMRALYNAFILKLAFVLVVILVIPVISFTTAKQARAACQNNISDAIFLEVTNTRTGQQIFGASNEDIRIGDILHVNASTSPDPNGGYVISGGFVRTQFGTFDPSPAPHHEVDMYNGYDYAIEVDMTVRSMPDYIYVHITGTCLADYEQPSGDFQLDFGQTVPDFECAPIVPLTQIDPGGTATLGVHTTSVAGFNSNVNYNVTLTANPGTPNTNPPILGAVTGNNQPPPSDTTVGITTSSSTVPGNYTVHFNGSGGGQSHNCDLSLRINPLDGDFNLAITPLGTPSNPVKTLIGNNATFQVFAECFGDFNGPITNLTASTAFSNVTTNINANQINCGSTATITVSNTASIPASQQSTYPDPADFHPEDVIVSGKGQI